MHTSGLRIQDVISEDKLKELMRSFYEAFDVPCAIYSADRRWILKHGWQEICTKFHRVHPETERLCRESDDYIRSRLNRGGHVAYQCANGLIDVAFPIMVEGNFLGTFFIGQFLFEPPDEVYFRKQAQTRGFEVEAYMAALAKVKVIPRKTVDRIMAFFIGLMGLITDMGHEVLNRKRNEAELEALRAHLEDKVRERTREFERSEGKYRKLVENSPAAIYSYSQKRGGFYVSSRIEDILGYSAEHLMRHPHLWNESVHPDDKAAVDEAIRQHDKGQDFAIEYRIKDAAGNWRWLYDRSMKQEPGKTSQGIEGVVLDITPRKKAEEALRGALAELEAIFESSQVGVMLLRGERKLAKANLRLALILGYDSPEEMIGVSMRELHLSQKNFEEFGKRYYYPLARGVIQQVEFRLRKKDGSPVWCSLSGKALDDGPKPNLDKGVLWIVDDIMRRKKIEEALRESERRFRTVVEGIPTGLVITNDAQEIEYVNPEFTRLFGYTLRDVPDVPRWWPLAYPDEKYRFESMRLWDEVITGAHKRKHEGKALERIVRCKNGESKIVEFRYMPLGKKGLTLLTDITRRKMAQDALQRSEERFREFVEGTSDLVVQADAEGVILFANHASKEVYGLAPEECLGLSFTEFLHPEDMDRTLAEMRGWLGRKLRHTSLGNRQVRKDGVVRHVLWDVNIHYAEDGSPRVINGIARDITTIMEAERALQAAMADLENANAELSQYAYVVSHDLKSPLRAIHNYADFLREDLGEKDLDPDVRSYLDGMSKAVAQSEKLVDDLLELSRVGKTKSKTQRVDLHALFHDIAEEIGTDGDKTAISIPGDIPEIQSDPILLRQTFLNLLTNAVKFNRTDKKRVDVSWKTLPGPTMEINVEDNGIGIEPQYREQIFRVFQRLHTQREFEGTGIGLAIVKKAMRALGGEVFLESEPGRGSVFTVRFPLNS